MLIHFEKYQGAGNDFILLDNREGQFSELNNSMIAKMCNRNYGIGSDGIICINASEVADFEMKFFNPDGSQSFCGNGARCSVVFAKKLEIPFHQSTFVAYDGIHKFIYDAKEVSIQMNDVNGITFLNDSSAFLDTGSPHYVVYSEDLSTENTVKLGKQIRYSDAYISEGVNVNLIQEVSENTLRISTYERGVENETLACGTGATAVALFAAHRNQLTEGTLNVIAKGGDLKVKFSRNDQVFTDIWLSGPVEFVYKGLYSLL